MTPFHELESGLEASEFADSLVAVERSLSDCDGGALGEIAKAFGDPVVGCYGGGLVIRHVEEGDCIWFDGEACFDCAESVSNVSELSLLLDGQIRDAKNCRRCWLAGVTRCLILVREYLRRSKTQ